MVVVEKTKPTVKPKKGEKILTYEENLGMNIDRYGDV